MFLLSLPARGAWIEILFSLAFSPLSLVAPREGSVDRNFQRGIPSFCQLHVAPREGSVDRNVFIRFISDWSRVAPREGSVDRNKEALTMAKEKIEVAPREGSVDRNQKCTALHDLYCTSLPARGAWIEIAWGRPSPRPSTVAPREGSVDRNGVGPKIVHDDPSRSPRGERG